MSEYIGDLILGIIGIVGSIFVIYNSYKYLRKGKIRSINVFAHKIYSFKKEPVEASLILLINLIAFFLLLYGGGAYILRYINFQ